MAKYRDPMADLYRLVAKQTQARIAPRNPLDDDITLTPPEYPYMNLPRQPNDVISSQRCPRQFVIFSALTLSPANGNYCPPQALQCVKTSGHKAGCDYEYPNNGASKWQNKARKTR